MSRILLTTLMLLLVLANAPVSRSDTSDIPGQDASGMIAAAEVSGQEAFILIQTVDREGGNVTILANRFNEALEMLDRAEAYMDGGVYDQAITAMEGAQQLFRAIGNDAVVLQEQAAAEASNRIMTILLVDPIVVILITLSSYYLIRLWLRRGIARTLEMEVREVEAR